MHQFGSEICILIYIPVTKAQWQSYWLAFSLLQVRILLKPNWLRLSQGGIIGLHVVPLAKRNKKINLKEKNKIQKKFSQLLICSLEVKQV